MDSGLVWHHKISSSSLQLRIKCIQVGLIVRQIARQALRARLVAVLAGLTVTRDANYIITSGTHDSTVCSSCSVLNYRSHCATRFWSRGFRSETAAVGGVALFKPIGDAGLLFSLFLALLLLPRERKLWFNLCCRVRLWGPCKSHSASSLPSSKSRLLDTADLRLFIAALFFYS